MGRARSTKHAEVEFDNPISETTFDVESQQISMSPATGDGKQQKSATKAKKQSHAVVIPSPKRLGKGLHASLSPGAAKLASGSRRIGTCSFQESKLAGNSGSVAAAFQTEARVPSGGLPKTKAAGNVEGGFKTTDLMHHHSTWSRAVEMNQGVCTGRAPMLVGLARLFGWHLLLPCVYLLCFGLLHADGMIDRLQLVFAGILAVRMALSIAVTLTTLKVNPAFLLVDLAATVRQKDAVPAWDGGWAAVLMYVLCPEKFVAFALVDMGGLGHPDFLPPLAFASIVLDLVAGVGGVVCGTLSGVLPAELWLVYALTIISAVAMISVLNGSSAWASCVVVAFVACAFCFEFVDRWVWCNGEACEAGQNPGMPSTWAPPRGANGTATSAVWGFALL
jgi:hypothetical protein